MQKRAVNHVSGHFTSLGKWVKPTHTRAVTTARWSVVVQLPSRLVLSLE